MELTDVSRTAIATLRSRVIEARRPDPILLDPMASLCLERLRDLATEAEKLLLFDRRLPRRLTNHIALRTRHYDRIAGDYIAGHPSCTVVNLGCGFDTRFWRIDHSRCAYIELDLPEIIDLKKAVLGEHLTYPLLGCSVLDPAWIESAAARGGREVLLIAEGLFMYLPRAGVIGLLRTLTERLRASRIAFEVVTEKYTRGLWKKIVAMKIKRVLGLDAGSSYSYGVGSAAEIETYAPGLRVLDEWSYVEDPRVRPRLLKYLGLARTQWTVTAAIN